LIKNKISLSKFLISDITENYLIWIRDKSLTKFTEIKNTKIENVIKYVIDNNKKRSLLKILFNKIHIGNLRIEKIRKGKATLGILIGNKKFHNKGIGTKVIKMAINLLKKDKNIKTIIAGINDLNYPSQSIFKKNNFVKKKNSDFYYYNV